ncbi:hypothetical protein QF032_004285 [Streptomyces achromogenes]|uniref:hypothetical protein n=1 Tax=Streptomyces achromogenes TaxID=67255 RepID=UPI00277F1923|nr:hypothetical protein [Streptomyces achromogenes]MDQ0832441.1 hypothetical protein [Streptomyces achromogenes]
MSGITALAWSGRHLPYEPAEPAEPAEAVPAAGRRGRPAPVRSRGRPYGPHEGSPERRHSPSLTPPLLGRRPGVPPPAGAAAPEADEPPPAGAAAPEVDEPPPAGAAAPEADEPPPAGPPSRRSPGAAIR